MQTFAFTAHPVPEVDAVVCRWWGRSAHWEELAHWLDEQPGVEEVRAGRYGCMVELAGHVVTTERFIAWVQAQVPSPFRCKLGEPIPVHDE